MTDSNAKAPQPGLDRDAFSMDTTATDCFHQSNNNRGSALSDELVSAAIFYASVGLPVIPLRQGRKIPWLSGWQDAASTDPSVIREWWARTPLANVGVVTGGSWFTVDIDVKNDPDGLSGYQSIMYFEQDSGIDWSAWPFVRTPSGGGHIWAKKNRPLSTRTPWLADVDLLADGNRIVVMPPSVLDGTFANNSYRFAQGDLGHAPTATDQELDLISKVHRRSLEAGVSVRVGDLSPLPSIEDLLRNGLPRGDRHNGMHRLLCSWWVTYGDSEERLVRDLAWMVWDASPEKSGWPWEDVAYDLPRARSFALRKNEERASTAGRLFRRAQ